MSDFEIISVVIMIASLVLKAIKFGRDMKDKKTRRQEVKARPPSSADW